MEKVLLFMGATEGFRSQPQKAVRSQRAVDKGYLVAPDTTVIVQAVGLVHTTRLALDVVAAIPHINLQPLPFDFPNSIVKWSLAVVPLCSDDVAELKG